MAVMTLSFRSSNGRRLSFRHLADRLTNDVDDGGRRSHERRVIHGMRANPGLHPLGHEAVIVFDDHAILFGDEEPDWPVLPQRPPHFDGVQAGEIGRWTAASTASSSWEAFCAKAAANAA